MPRKKEPAEAGARASTPKRKDVRPRLRFEVFKRDGFACVYCGAGAPGVILHADHVDPVALGGEDDIENLVTACAKCNQGKGAVPLGVASEVHTRRTALDRARAVAEIDAAYNDWLGERRRAVDERAKLMVAEWNREAFRGEWRMGEASALSMAYFAKHMLDEELRDAMYATIRRIPWPYFDPKWKPDGQKYRAAHVEVDRRFRYFCGICHRTIKARQGAQ